MPLKVIGAGFGRTGTLSLKYALEELGFNACYHVVEALKHPEHLPTWEAAARGEEVNWEDVFHDYQAAVDWPAAAFYRELMDRYPDARVILTVRDADGWYESTRKTIYTMFKLVSRPPVTWFQAIVASRRLRINLITARLYWEDLFDGKFEDREHALKVFHCYNQEVQRYVPAERLLVFDVKQGWEPLCTFLGVPAPRDKPFPHANEGDTFRKWIRAVRMLAYGGPVLVTLLIVSAVIGWRWTR